MLRNRSGLHLFLGGLLLLVALAAGRTQAAEPSAEAVQALEKWLAAAPADRPALAPQPFAQVPLTRGDAERALDLLWKSQVESNREALSAEWDAKKIQIGESELRFDYLTFGEKPEAGWDLYISLHGGGNTRPEINEGAWRRHLNNYKPKQGLVFVPRSPSNTWNMWHTAQVDPLLDRAIQGAILIMGCNPDRVYLMGYSAGGDGVYQLAPRLSDRLAAAAMMAGHPNETSPLGLRNIGFTIHMGGDDSQYRRNEIAREWGEKLDALQKQDPKGYAHVVQIHEGMGHGMRGADAVALDWLVQFTRNPLPDKVVWKQDDVAHPAFYWLGVAADQKKGGSEIVAERDGQTITVLETSGVEQVLIRLSDAMADLDKEIVVLKDGKTVFQGVVPRTLATLWQTLEERKDPKLAFAAEVPVEVAPSGK